MKLPAKAVAALLSAVGTWGLTASVGGISIQEYFGLLIALGGAYAVYLTPFEGSKPSGKRSTSL